ncbi:hypothetical protein M406DRAFT_327247 [Cryphonectria parasitica EP155]|uniref:Uncharacterized protein n=1 Tax=Cryphonectria parasitica (strain ATCC 38755 / EP155) TaxID=660469 RepID=A0A9P5CRR0_CRYP1|nr:uncharacterized protein M406DRAFT_327247 [Cryphonectria parasitica EP155]KAF3768829.1 hypothetical protein M406DRAFT_327247 [Cryphonectria parasitica EP155]
MLEDAVDALWGVFSNVRPLHDRSAEGLYFTPGETVQLQKMTKAGKCDCCRQRKVKKVRRDCKYTYGHVSKFVNYQHESSGPSSSSPSGKGDSKQGADRKHRPKDQEMVLSLRSSKNLQSGNNLMQTFNLVPANKRDKSSHGGEVRYGGGDESPQANEHQASLLSLWLSYLESGPSGESSLYCMGDWMDIVQRYIGRGDVVDAAVIAIVSGARALSSRAEEDIATASESNINALRVLRLSLAKDNQESDSRMALVATKLLYIAEITSAMFRGERSAFEKTAWTDMPAPQFADNTWPGYAAALKDTMQGFTKLARLVHLTRRVQQKPHDVALRSDATSLAGRLFGSSIEAWIGELMGSGGILVVPSVANDHLVTHSYRFQSPRLYQLIVTFWAGRVILCGCIQRLADTGRLPSALSLAAAYETDIQSAHAIAMCADYCMQIDSTLPCAQIAHLPALRIAFGAWQRLGERAVGQSTESEEMTAWCLGTLNVIETMLSLRLSTHEELYRRTSCLSGGPVYESG